MAVSALAVRTGVLDILMLDGSNHHPARYFRVRASHPASFPRLRNISVFVNVSEVRHFIA